MDRESGLPLRVGVIGLGRLWEARHKPALTRSADRFRVAALYDQVGWRAEFEARQLGCQAVPGVSALLGHPEVDAVLLLAPQWFGWAGLAMAMAAGKPIYCALSPCMDPSGFARAARGGSMPFMAELPRRFYPATLRLRELLATTLGPPRLILGRARMMGYDRYAAPGPTCQTESVPLWADPGANIIDWCRVLFGEPPRAVRSTGDEVRREEIETHLVEFPSGLAQIVLTGFPAGDRSDDSPLPPPGFEVHAERGTAWIQLPDRIVWQQGSMRREERLAGPPDPGEIMLDQFARLARGQSSIAPTLADAVDLARLAHGLRDAIGCGSRVEFADIPQA